MLYYTLTEDNSKCGLFLLCGYINSIIITITRVEHFLGIEALNVSG